MQLSAHASYARAQPQLKPHHVGRPLVGLERRDRERLLDALTERGWIWEGDHVFAPRRTMWLLCASPWQGDLFGMLDSMRGRLERIQRLPPVAGVGEESEAADDTAELVLVLERLIGESSRRP